MMSCKLMWGFIFIIYNLIVPLYGGCMAPAGTVINNFVPNPQGNIDLCDTEGYLRATQGIFGCNCTIDPDLALQVCGDGHVSGSFEVLTEFPSKKRFTDEEDYTLISNGIVAFHQVPNISLVRSENSIYAYQEWADGFLSSYEREREREIDILPYTNGPGIKLFWVPELIAFRAGVVDSDCPDCWDTLNTGVASAGFGIDTKSSGVASIASGIDTLAEGVATTAQGISCAAGSVASLCTGISNNASGVASIASGIFSNATAVASSAGNLCSRADDVGSTVFGASTVSTGFASTVTGQCNAIPDSPALFVVGDGESTSTETCLICNTTHNVLEVRASEVDVNGFLGVTGACECTTLDIVEDASIGTELIVTGLLSPLDGFEQTTNIVTYVVTTTAPTPASPGAIAPVVATCAANYLAIGVTCSATYAGSPTVQLALISNEIFSSNQAGRCIYEVINTNGVTQVTLVTRTVCMHIHS